MGEYMGLDGKFYDIEDHVASVVYELQERFPELKLQYLEPDPRTPIALRDPPYVIVENCADGVERVVKRVWQLDSRLIDELYAMRDLTVAQLEAKFQQEQAKARAAQKAEADLEREKAKDIAEHVFKSPKTSYTFKNDEGKLIKVTDG